MKDTDNIELTYLTIEDYEDLKKAMLISYPNMESYWEKTQIEKLLSIFPDGQVVIKVNGKLAGSALSIIVNYSKYENNHTYSAITANGTFKSHDKNGDVLYGIDVFILPEYRGLRLGRRLYDYRKGLCEKLNLKGIAFGGRMPNYNKYAKELSPKEYIDKVKSKEIYDPVLRII